MCVCVRETTVILGGRCVLSSSVPPSLLVYSPLSWALLCTACSSCPRRVVLTNQKGASPAPATRVWFQVSDCGRTSCAQAQSKSRQCLIMRLWPCGLYLIFIFRHFQRLLWHFCGTCLAHAEPAAQPEEQKTMKKTRNETKWKTNRIVLIGNARSTTIKLNQAEKILKYATAGYRYLNMLRVSSVLAFRKNNEEY